MLSNVVPIKPPVPEIPIDHPSRHWQTTAVLGLTLAFLFWLRQDAGSVLAANAPLGIGLVKAVDSPNWQSGAKWTKDLDRELGEKLQGRQAIRTDWCRALMYCYLACRKPRPPRIKQRCN